MNNFKTEELVIEITRVCNRKCVHCMRGTAQKSTITKDIIDRIFQEISNCYHIALTGGEPLLAIDMIEYLVDKIILSEWNIKVFQLTTNGTIIDERIVRCLNKLCSHKPECCSILRISGDQYHNTNQAQLAYEAYSNFPKSDKVTVLIKESLNSIKFSGRAKDLVTENSEQLPKDKDFIGIAVPYINQYRIPVKDNTIQTDLIICSNGNVSFSEEVSFAELDLLAIGNLLESDLKTLIETHNRDCLLTHCDWENIQTIKQSLIGFNDYGLSTYIRDKVGELIFDGIYKHRIKAHEMFPYIPAQNIILNLPMPKDYILDINAEIDMIFDIVQPLLENMSMQEWEEWLQGVDSDIYDLYETRRDEFDTDCQKSFSVYAVLQNPSVLEDEMLNLLCEYTFFFRLITTQNQMGTFEFIRLEQLNEKYKAGELKYHNDKLLPYDIGDSLFGEENLFQAVLDLLIKQSGKEEETIELQNGIKAII